MIDNAARIRSSPAPETGGDGFSEGAYGRLINAAACDKLVESEQGSRSAHEELYGEKAKDSVYWAGY